VQRIRCWSVKRHSPPHPSPLPRWGRGRSRKENSRQTACKPGSVHRVAATLWPFLWDVRYRTPHATYPDDDPETDHVPSLFGLAPGGVCRAVCVATSAVRSYRTVSPLPRLTPIGGLLSVALSLGFPPADVIRHRVSVEPGLSSKPRLREAPRPSDHLTRSGI